MRELVCPRHMCKVPLGKCMEWDIDEVTGERIQCNEKPVMSTTLYWCKQCNVPIYEESCPLCGEKGKYIATDIRPVFPEEKILLAILLEKDDPLCFEELSVWNNTNFYFIDGEKIQVSIKDFNGKTLDEIQKIKKKYDEYSAQIDYSKFDKIVSRFIQANENRYNEVTDEAISFVQEYKERYSLEDMFVSFSGGKDSTVTSDIVRRAFSSNKVYHIFGDTTLEFPLTYEYKKRFATTKNIAPFFGSYDDFFSELEILTIQDDVVSCNSLPYDKEFIYMYATVLWKYWDEFYPEQDEISSVQFAELGFGKAFGWDLKAEYEVMEHLADRELIRMNRQLMPYTILKLVTEDELTNNLYSELC